MTIGGEIPETLDEQDAFMITGSPLSVLDDHIFSKDLADFIRRCDKAKKPLMGACFGHQAIAQALGAKVEKVKEGYNVGIEDMQFHSSRSWMTPKRDVLPMYVFHEDQVLELPEGCDLLASSQNCKIASFAKENHIFTTQAHPEFSHDFMSCVLKFTESKIEATKVKNAWESLTNDQSGDIFAKWASNFFQGNIANVR